MEENQGLVSEMPQHKRAEMKHLISQFRQLKKLVSGSREKTVYEDSFIVPPEEKYLISPPGRWQARIMGELEFALQMASHQSESWMKPLGKAMSFLLAQIKIEGTLTAGDAQYAEDILRHLQTEARSYRVILAGHAHIDMNWMWSWHETVTATLDTFRTVLMLMDSYPAFCFSQSQAAVYRLVEEHDPEMMAAIQEKIREGRWEVTASSWVEKDRNMPSTESQIRHMLVAKSYLEKSWGVPGDSLKVDFSPDTFGHAAQVPEIDRHGGIKYLYHCRGLDGDQILFRWRAPSGAELLTYREPLWYNGSVSPHFGVVCPVVSAACAGLKTSLAVYGIGDHGGGPTRRDIERILEMQTWPVFPELRFGTFREYFAAAEEVRHLLPVVEGELNVTFPGCYTTQSRIKRANRMAEMGLGEAETYMALAMAHAGIVHRPGRYAKAWEKVLFTHFHDILTGSCVQESREHAMGLYDEAQAVADADRKTALLAIAKQIDTSWVEETPLDENSRAEGAGPGYAINGISVSAAECGNGRNRIYHIFNHTAYDRKEQVELALWDWPGDFRQLCILDFEGKTVPHQLLDKEWQTYWDHRYVRLLAELDLPAYGYVTCVLTEREMEEYPLYFQPRIRTSHPIENPILENEFVRVEIHSGSGGVCSILEKSSGREWIKPGQCVGLRFGMTEDATSSAWNIGRILSMSPVVEAVRMRQEIPEGGLRQAVTVDMQFANSTAEMTIRLDRHAPVISWDLSVDWHEISKKGELVPLLDFAVPLARTPDAFRYGVPAGQLDRLAASMDVPALRFGSAVSENSALVLLSDSKYGYRANHDVLSLTLLHAPKSPDPYPEQGIHGIRIGVALTGSAPGELEAAAGKFLAVPAVVTGKRRSGKLPPTASLFHIEEGNDILVTGIKPSEDGHGLIVRLVNLLSSSSEAVLITRFIPTSAEQVDALERPVQSDVKLRDTRITTSIPPKGLISLFIQF